jgi:hypothetical protein
MKDLLETLIAAAWNRRRRVPEIDTRGVNIGQTVIDDRVTGSSIVLAHAVRAHHIAILGKTGMGKSSLLRHLSAQDIRDDIGFLHFDLHGETTPYVLSLLAAEERRRGVDLSDRVILIDPADPDWAVGVNVLATESEADRFLLIAEVSQILKQRWHLDTFGARTEELLRNALLVLSERALTLLELSPLLTNATFRRHCVSRIRNAEVATYFTTRYDTGSDASQHTWRDAVLNKITTFTADPHFRHLLGQTRSTVSLVEAMDRGCWVLLNLEKGRLGEHAATLGSVFLTKLKTALFARRRRTLFTVYADELQNLVAFDSGVDTLLAEARKFSISMCSGNQFLAQYPPTIQAAVQSVGTQIFFQLSPPDAARTATALGGGRSLQELLKNLKPRQFVMKSGHHPWRHGVVPLLRSPRVDTHDLRRRSLQRWARRRMDIEREIRARHADVTTTGEAVLDAWD